MRRPRFLSEPTPSRQIERDDSLHKLKRSARRGEVWSASKRIGILE